MASTNVNLFKTALANRTVAVGDIFLVPSLFPGVPGRTLFECHSVATDGAIFTVAFEGAYLCKVKASYSVSPTLERVP